MDETLTAAPLGDLTVDDEATSVNRTQKPNDKSPCSPANEERKGCVSNTAIESRTAAEMTAVTRTPRGLVTRSVRSS